MRIGWIEMWTGLGGDMMVGALLDAGWPEDRLRAGVAALGLGPCTLTVERRTHRSLTGLGLRVDAPGDPPHRHYTDIVRLLQAAALPDLVRQRALEAFRMIGEAEARVHGVSIERVHFHEIGAYDSIVDVVGAILGAYELGLERIFAGAAPVGTGEVEIGHGRVPVPAPATAILLEGWPVRSSGVAGEFFTPTAAALLRVLARPSAALPAMRVSKIGYGAGTREHPTLPNLVRLWIGDAETDAARAPEDLACGRVAVLETQIDDMDPRFLAALADRLPAAGALDAYRTPIAMKKGRQGTLLTVIARPEAATALAALVLAESSTLGVRVREEDRWEAPRRIEEVSTKLGAVHVKWADILGRRVPSIEFTDLDRLANEHGLPLEEVRIRVLSELMPSRWDSPDAGIVVPRRNRAEA